MIQIRQKKGQKFCVFDDKTKIYIRQKKEKEKPIKNMIDDHQSK